MPEAAPKSPKAPRSLIAEFEVEYACALDEARVSAALTEETGWQKLYQSERKHQRGIRLQLAEQLKSLAGMMERAGLDEYSEKQLGEIKKDSIALRDRVGTFHLQTVGPVSEPVQKCIKLIADYREKARREEENSPLTDMGVDAEMRFAISTVAKPAFDSETGIVSITEAGK
jgi:hypothetical protein